MARYVIVQTLFINLAAAYVNVNYPLNFQLPPVAHVGASYQFQFAPTTFQSDSNKLQYTLNGNPSWLSLDGNSRTLSGTPRDGDTGEASFTITAAGAAGIVANMPSKLLVTKNSGPKSKANVTQVLSSAGQLSDSKTISIAPSKPFSISFPLDSFDNSAGQLSYSALLSDRTPLPAWIGFDATTLLFSGSTPPITTSQSFDIVLIASSTAGYTASSISFTMAVNFHQLLFQPFNQSTDLNKGADIRISDIRSKLLLDGVPIEDSDLQAVTAKLPDWLSLNSKTAEISGKAPQDLMSQDITVTAKDRFGDSAQLRIHLSFKSDLFGTEIGPLSITAGTQYNYQLPDNLLSQKGVITNLDFSSLSDYLHFDPKSLTISGEIPADHAVQTVECTLSAASNDGSRKDTQAFKIEVGATESNGSNLAPAEQPTPTEVDKAAGRKKAGIIIGVVIGTIVAIVLLAILILFLRQRRKKQSYLSPKSPRSPRKSDISRPTFIPYGWPDMDLSEDQDLEKGKHDDKPGVDRTPEHPPKLDLDLLDDRKDSHSLTDSLNDADTGILDSYNESAWGLQNAIAPSQHPHGSMKIPTAELAKRASSRSDTYRKHKRRTTTIYQDHIVRSSGLPVNRRITGMGHGRHTYSPSRSNVNFPRSNARRPLSTSTYTTTRCTSTLSTAPSALPQAPVARKHLTKVTVPREERRSIRIVPTSIRGSPSDRRTLDEKRLSYIRKRASAQSPFFTGDGIRESSGSYRSPPAFISEAQPTPVVEGTQSTRPVDVIVRPDDDVPEGKGKELPNISHPRKPSIDTTSASSTRAFPGSLRQNRKVRPITAIKAKPNRIEKYYNRYESFDAWEAGMRRRASTRESLRAYDLKTSLNNLTGSEIFKDADLSDSVYTDEEDDIEEATNRRTMKPSHFTLPPLNINTKRRSKRKSDEKKRTKKDDGKKQLKRASERDPTPYYYATPPAEHGGKENQSSTYSLGTRSSPVRNEPKRKTIATDSPARSSVPLGVPPQARPASDMRKPQRNGTIQPQAYYQERHSRRSLHSRAQSRASGAAKRARDHSRQQSTAYPFFDAASIDMKRSSIGNAITTAADSVCMPHSKGSLVQRDLSGNLTFYHNSDEEPTIEELGSSSIGIRTSNGRISHHAARQSRLASLHESSPSFGKKPPQPPRKSSKRDTTVLEPQTEASKSNMGTSAKPTGLGLFPVDTRAELIAAGVEAGERSPLGTLQGENKARGSGLVEDDGGKGRQTWGSLKTIMGRGSKWVSGGYWEKQGKDDKVFI